MIKLSQRDSWILYLDDERNPEDGKPWVIARTAQEAKNLVLQKGMPSFVKFDHDLGYTIPEEMKKNGPSAYPYVKTPIGYMRDGIKIEETGLDFAKWLIEQDQNGTNVFPEDFGFSVHSANPEGKKNIQSMMDRYLRFKEEEQ